MKYIHVKVHTAEVTGVVEKTFYVAYENLMVAKLTCSDWEKEGAWITWLYVDENYRRMGVATQLLRAAIDYAKAHGKHGMGLAIKKYNLTAKYLYLMHDFVTCYEANDELVMTRHIVHRNSFPTPQDLAATIKLQLAEEAAES